MQYKLIGRARWRSWPSLSRADVRMRLALGAEIPGRVDLQRFPDGIVDRMPQIGEYGFIGVDDNVVVVDPRDRSVALVITE